MESTKLQLETVLCDFIQKFMAVMAEYYVLLRRSMDDVKCRDEKLLGLVLERRERAVLDHPLLLAEIERAAQCLAAPQKSEVFEAISIINEAITDCPYSRDLLISPSDYPLLGSLIQWVYWWGRALRSRDCIDSPDEWLGETPVFYLNRGLLIVPLLANKVRTGKIIHVLHCSF